MQRVGDREVPESLDEMLSERFAPVMLVIDCKRDFADPSGHFARSGLDVAPAQAALPTIGLCLAGARVVRLPIVHLHQNMLEGGASDSDAWLYFKTRSGRAPDHTQPGSWGAAQVYAGLSRLVRRLPSGLLQANTAGCAVFSAISGSSVATVAGIGTVALPQLIGRGCSRSLSAGSLAAGGTVGILIPPSIAFIVYGTFTDTSVSQLFFAGLLPGLMMTGLFMLHVAVRATLDASFLPSPGAARDLSDDTHAALSAGTANDILPFTVLIGATLGSIYAGIATPKEAAAMGCAFSIVIGAVWGRLTPALFLGCLVGCIGIMVITLPVLFPILLAYEIALIWFGVMMVILIEIGQMTPPLGINLFVIQGIWDGRIEEVIRGGVPFFLVMLSGLGLIWAVPEIATWLQSCMVAR